MTLKTPFWLLFYASALLSVSGSSCQSKKMEEKYDWSGTLSAPQEYPAEVYEGKLSAKDYTQNFKDWGIISSGWGNPNGTVVVGPDVKPLPDSLSITWLSFAENKFYTGNFALPKDKLTKLFKEGYTNEQDKKENYEQIVVGLAPGGTVVVWVMGAERETEVEKFKAHPASIDPENVGADDKYMFKPNYVKNILADPMIIPAEVRDYINKNGATPPGNYEVGYRRLYNWKPVFVLDGKVQSFTINMYNGERDRLTGNRLITNEIAERALPKMAGFYWNGADGKEHGARILFDEKEITNAFNAAGSGNLDIVFKPEGNTVSISLKSERKEIVIKNAQVKAF